MLLEARRLPARPPRPGPDSEGPRVHPKRSVHTPWGTTRVLYSLHRVMYTSTHAHTHTPMQAPCRGSPTRCSAARKPGSVHTARGCTHPRTARALPELTRLPSYSWCLCTAAAHWASALGSGQLRRPEGTPGPWQ